jgi:hypothetical protein
MPTAAFTYDPEDTTAVADAVSAEGSFSFSFSQLPPADDLVLIPGGFLPRDQEYYWSKSWQTDERETLAQIAAGEGVEFDNAADLVKWLFDS